MGWSRKVLKKNAKQTLRHNYVGIIIVSFLIAILAAGYASSTVDLGGSSDELFFLKIPTVSKEIEKTIGNVGIRQMDKNAQNIEPNGLRKTITALESETKKSISKVESKYNLKNAREGVFATLINTATNSSSFLVGILNTVNQFLFNSKLLENVIVSAATVIMFLYWLFVQNILKVGECRFFLETKNYYSSDASRLLFVYRIKKTKHIAKIMCLRYLFNLLWYITVVGGVIKTYSYSMIPFIIAENPNISRKEAFMLSKKMMEGNKWKSFKLDVSFLWWHLLSVFTFGVLSFLYVNPLITATKAELYFALREELINHQPEYKQYFTDNYLLNPPNENRQTKYPTELFSIPEAYRKDWITIEYNRKYSVTSLVLIFFSISFIGWIWEVFLTLLTTGNLVNRGTLMGPWLPLYGTGSLLIIIFLKRWANKPLLFFASVFVVCGVLEYFTSWGLEKLFNEQWWDYSNMFFNINGRICLEGLIFFAVGGCLIIYFIAPLIDELLEKVPYNGKRIVCVVLAMLFLVDVIFSAQHPNKGEGITGISYQSGKK